MIVDKSSAVLRSLAAMFLVVVFAMALQTGNKQIEANQGFFPVPPLGQLWHFQCIDTMKYSRDAAREYLGDTARAQALVASQVQEIKSLGATCVSVATPYDEEFYPYLKIWADAVHKSGLTVWFRGNFSGWEGWFSYPLLKSADEHHAKLTAFITKHPELFSEGDIVSPAPEAENGILGNPWASSTAGKALRDFVWKSADTCQKAIISIHKKVNCGYFSANGDVARDVYNHDVLQKAGAVTVIDHYISSTVKYGQDLDLYVSKQGLPVVVGEFGAPIEDIHGTMTETEQAQFVGELLRQMYVHKNQILGLNYWVLNGGSTALLNSDGTERKVTEVVRDYFMSGVVFGHVQDGIGRPVKFVTVSTGDGVQQVQTDANGDFSLSVPPSAFDLVTGGGAYTQITSRTGTTRAGQVHVTLRVDPVHPSLWYRIRAALQRL
jgi:hypothetical protein